ncbi:MAG: Ribosomal-protein-alanine acetyltransferase [Candidatus Roizmanbacteria bacterium GW2011_GWA2_36_23]|uniref:Ribosomal-protein-alanine acetyltransferase n=1 Tax=Candidatus Roizmanbacteria bacterium GW2011_GWA2_36_23 TaxID=1618480 RepID=A0A0G0E956_9BACT|nr:MAG: Ribosomal-protein-alanine acetyltransferase [Candidatus Roizmanbacteria bacterium GW2011_GWA2_36_23]
MNIKFKEANLQDAETILKIEKSVSSLTYHSCNSVNDIIKDYLRKGFLFLILVDNKPAGIISYELIDQSFAYINGLIVTPEYQNQGIASKALAFLLSILKEIEKIELVTHPQNTAALKLYSKYGFIVTGQKENYYGDGEPRLILTKVNKKKL